MTVDRKTCSFSATVSRPHERLSPIPYSLLNNFCTRLPCSNVRDVRFVTQRNGPLFLRRYRIRTLDVARNYDDEIFHEVARSEMIRFLFSFSLSLSLLVIGHRGFFYRNEVILWLMELFIYYFFFFVKLFKLDSSLPHLLI